MAKVEERHRKAAEARYPTVTDHIDTAVRIDVARRAYAQALADADARTVTEGRRWCSVWSTQAGDTTSLELGLSDFLNAIEDGDHYD